MARNTLESIIIEKKFLTQQQLESVKQEALIKKISLSKYLIENSIISNDDMTKIYSDHLELQFFLKIEDDMADSDILSKIPLKFLKDNIIIPIIYNSEIKILTSNPINFSPIDELKIIFSNKTTIGVANQSVIIDALNHYYPIEGTDQMIEDLKEDADVSDASFSEIDETDILGVANDAPIIKLVNYILFQAVKMSASDIHIEPGEKDLRVRYRVDGIMHLALTPPKRVQNALSSRIKIMASLDIAEKRKPLDGRIEIKVADRAIDLRVSILPVKFGDSIVMRLLDKDRGFVKLNDIGLSQRDLSEITKAIKRPNGIILLSGPTGSGKTSTLYTLLFELNDPKVNIITVEDPVEYQMHGVQQVQVNEKVELTFAAALRSILRQDPDIIMIGETRDNETAQIAIQSALTGHLVLSTIHTNSAPATVTRLLDMKIESFLISSSIVAVIAQRLVRKLCHDCKEQYTPSEDLLESLSIPNKTQKRFFYRAKGCQECNSLGYKGRIAIFEVMTVTDNLSKLIMEKSSTNEIKKQAQKDGMTLLVEDGIKKIEKGLTSVEEVLSVATAFQAFEQ